MDFGVSKIENDERGVRYGFDTNPLDSGNKKEELWVMIWI
jgi:hypothetical protein